jgi:hypothetical protein
VSEQTEVAPWVQKLGIVDRTTGLERASEARESLLEAGRVAFGSVGHYTTSHVVFFGFLARAQGLHEGAVAAISAGNPYAAFTLLRSYAENAAAILYVSDHPAQLEKFWNDRRGSGVKIGKITNHAHTSTRFGGFKDIYSELSKYAHPHALSMLASTRNVGGNSFQWASAPAFKSASDLLMACAWVVELAVATSHLLKEFAESQGWQDVPQ